jgi:hypothetical protein
MLALTLLGYMLDIQRACPTFLFAPSKTGKGAALHNP